MIYVPDLENYKCYVVQSEGVLRGYEEVPHNNANISYRDFYINSDYIYRDGSQQFGQYSTLPVCLSNSILSTSLYYRNDFDKILVIFLILSIFIFFIPLKVFSKIFKRSSLWKSFLNIV